MAVREIQAINAYTKANTVRAKYKAILDYAKTWRYSCHGYIKFLIPKYIYRAFCLLSPSEYYLFVERVVKVFDGIYGFNIADEIYYSTIKLCMDAYPLLASAVGSKSDSYQIYDYLLYRIFKVLYGKKFFIKDEFLAEKLFCNLLVQGVYVVEPDLIFDMVRYLDSISSVDKRRVWWTVWNVISAKTNKVVLERVAPIALRYNEGYRADQIKDRLGKL